MKKNFSRDNDLPADVENELQKQVDIIISPGATEDAMLLWSAISRYYRPGSRSKLQNGYTQRCFGYRDSQGFDKNDLAVATAANIPVVSMPGWLRQ
jgi:hypothetical protein